MAADEGADAATAAVVAADVTDVPSTSSPEQEAGPRARAGLSRCPGPFHEMTAGAGATAVWPWPSGWAPVPVVM